MDEKTILEKIEETQNLVKELSLQLDLTEHAQSTAMQISNCIGLIEGLFLGILGNLCVSFLMETIHQIFGTTLFYTWLGIFVLSLVMTFVVSLLLFGQTIKILVSWWEEFRKKMKKYQVDKLKKYPVPPLSP
jgi:hypothetical protein